MANSLMAIVDADLFDDLNHYAWSAVRYQKSYYARTLHTPENPKRGFSMHRLVARTPANCVCHHRNRNSLDNRRANLVNMTRRDHNSLHRNETLSILFQDTSPGQMTSLADLGLGI